jgi:RNA polymerase sporulation-specific sigma factor
MLRERSSPAAPDAVGPAAGGELDVVVQPTVLGPGLAADELTGLVEMVEIADPEEVAAAEIAAEVEAELAREQAARALDAEIEQAEHLVDDLAGEVRSSAARPPATDGSGDGDLVMAARSGDDEALNELLTKYRAFARVKARSYFLIGGDREDLVQEGMIGLYKAIRDFNPDMQTSFRGFAEVCVTRQIITAIKTASRHKHGPLNNYVSFSRPVSDDDGGERTLSDVLPTTQISDPADLVISAERIRALQSHFDEVLSDLETEVLRLYVEGKSYQEIAERLQRHVKSIDNALQRIKKKLEGHLQARTAAEAG